VAEGEPIVTGKVVVPESVESVVKARVVFPLPYQSSSQWITFEYGGLAERPVRTYCRSREVEIPSAFPFTVQLEVGEGRITSCCLLRCW